MSTLKEDFETLDPAEEVQKAYDASSVENPFTPGRHSAALSMGCTLLNGVISPELQDFLDKGAYPNIYRDVVIVNWLSSLLPGEVNKINARLNVEEAIAQAFAWAEKENFTYGSKPYLDGLTYFSKTALSIFSSLYSVEKERSDPFPNGKTATSRPGKFPSALRQHKPAGKQRVT